MPFFLFPKRNWKFLFCTSPLPHGRMRRWKLEFSYCKKPNKINVTQSSHWLPLITTRRNGRVWSQLGWIWELHCQSCFVDWLKRGHLRVMHLHFRHQLLEESSSLGRVKLSRPEVPRFLDRSIWFLGIFSLSYSFNFFHRQACSHLQSLRLDIVDVTHKQRKFSLQIVALQSHRYRIWGYRIWGSEHYGLQKTDHQFTTSKGLKVMPKVAIEIRPTASMDTGYSSLSLMMEAFLTETMRTGK